MTEEAMALWTSALHSPLGNYYKADKGLLGGG